MQWTRVYIPTDGSRVDPLKINDELDSAANAVNANAQYISGELGLRFNSQTAGIPDYNGVVYASSENAYGRYVALRTPGTYGTGYNEVSKVIAPADQGTTFNLTIPEAFPPLAYNPAGWRLNVGYYSSSSETLAPHRAGCGPIAAPVAANVLSIGGQYPFAMNGCMPDPLITLPAANRGHKAGRWYWTTVSVENPGNDTVAVNAGTAFVGTVRVVLRVIGYYL